MVPSSSSCSWWCKSEYLIAGIVNSNENMSHTWPAFRIRTGLDWMRTSGWGAWDWQGRMIPNGLPNKGVWRRPQNIVSIQKMPNPANIQSKSRRTMKTTESYNFSLANVFLLVDDNNERVLLLPPRDACHFVDLSFGPETGVCESLVIFSHMSQDTVCGKPAGHFHHLCYECWFQTNVQPETR